MKLRLLFLTMAAFITATSFHPADEGAKTQGSFYATLDGKAFQLGSNELFRGLLVNKPGSMDGRTPARAMISANFNGPKDSGTGNEIFTENIQFEIGYVPGKTGPAPNFAVMLKHQLAHYGLMKEQCNLPADKAGMNITAFTWEEDKKHFFISADFDCKMRSVNYPTDGKRDIALKGKMNNIRITVPSAMMRTQL